MLGYIRAFGLRDGFLLWRIALRLRLDRRPESRWRTHHGTNPTLPGYRRKP